MATLFRAPCFLPYDPVVVALMMGASLLDLIRWCELEVCAWELGSLRTGEKFREGCFLIEDCVLLLELSVVRFCADWRRRRRCVWGLGGGNKATLREAREGWLSFVGEMDMAGRLVL